MDVINVQSLAVSWNNGIYGVKSNLFISLKQIAFMLVCVVGYLCLSRNREISRAISLHGGSEGMHVTCHKVILNCQAESVLALG